MGAPIKHTCPDIDKYIKSIKHIMVKDRDLRNMSEKDLYETASSMNSELEDCISYLEDLRKSNGELREWGEQLDKDLSNAADEIYNLEQKLEELQKQTA